MKEAQKRTARVPTRPRHPPPPLQGSPKKATARVPTRPRHPPPPLLRTGLRSHFVVIVEAGEGLSGVGTLAVAFWPIHPIRSAHPIRFAKKDGGEESLATYPPIA